MPARPTRTIAIVTVAAVVVAGGAWGISRLVSDDDPASDAGTASSTGGGVPLDVSAGGPYRVEAGTDLLLDASIAVSGQTDVAADLAAIGAAIVAYRDDLGVYPPAYLTDADGNPTLSWRVLVLPYLGEDELYAKFDLTKAWDDPANAELVGEIPAVFRADTAGSDVASPAPGDTSYAGVSGDKHVFRAGGASPDDGLPSAAVSDGNSYTLGAGPVGAQVSIPWSSPGDIDTFEHPTLGDPAGFDGPGDLVTPLVDGKKECAFTIFENGVALCGIEKAWKDGKIPFRKPISCHLYPIRIAKLAGYEGLNYHKWKLCKPACTCGAKLDVPVFRFLKDALTRKYGAQWYSELEAIYAEWVKEGEGKARKR